MKILYHHRIGSKDGQFVHIEELTRALARQGHTIIMAGPRAVARERLGYEPGTVASLKRLIPRGIYELMEFSYSIVDFWRLWSAVRRHRPDCLYERYSLFLPTGVWLRRLHRLPMLLEVNAPLWEERSRYGGVFWSKLARWTECLAWRGADYVLAVTEVLARRIRSAGVPDSKIVVIPNGVDPSRFENLPTSDDLKRRLGLEGRLVLGFTGFVREWHGLERVVDYLSRTRDRGGGSLHLLIVGDGPACGALRAQARDRGVEDRVTFAGVVDRSEVASYIGAFDIALQPAVVEYASPLKLFEYLVLGRAILAPATANLKEILTHGEDALMFDPDDPGAFEAALDRLCADAALRRDLGDRAQRLVQERGLTWHNNALRVVELFRRLGVEGPVAGPLGVAGPTEPSEPAARSRIEGGA